jgi:hypothetical protein
MHVCDMDLEVLTLPKISYIGKNPDSGGKSANGRASGTGRLGE